MMSHTPLPGGGGAPMKPNTMVDQVEPDIKPTTTIHVNNFNGCESITCLSL